MYFRSLGWRHVFVSCMTLCFEEVRQVAVPVGRQDNYSVWSSSSECGTGGGVKSSIYDWLVTSPPGGVRSIVMSMSVCLSARITRKPRDRTSPIFVRVAYVGVEIRYVLPVLWVTSRFHVTALWSVMHSSAATEHDTNTSRDSNQILLDDKDQNCEVSRIKLSLLYTILLSIVSEKLA